MQSRDDGPAGAQDRREQAADEREIAADRRERDDDVREGVLDRWERELTAWATAMELLDDGDVARLAAERAGRAHARRARRAAADERREAAIEREVDRTARATPTLPGDAIPQLEQHARTTLARLGAVVGREASLGQALSAVMETAAEIFDAAAGVTIALTNAGRLEPAASSAAWAAELDAVQLREGTGPIADAIEGCTVVVSPDLAGDDRWRLAEAVGPNGRRGVLTVAFVAGHDAPGSLTVYAAPGQSFGRDAVLAATLLAALASAAVGLALERMSNQAQSEAWQRSLASRDLIGQAKGILMAQHGVNAEAAFDLLRATSQERNTKVRDVAAAVVTDRRLPDASDPS